MTHMTWLGWRVGRPPPRNHAQVLPSFTCPLSSNCTPSPLISKRLTAASKSHLLDYSPEHKAYSNKVGGAAPSVCSQLFHLLRAPAVKGVWVLFYLQLFQNGNGTGDFNPALGKSCLFLTPFTGCLGPFVLDIQGHSSETQPWGLLPFSESGLGKLLTPFKPRDAGQFLPLLCPTPAPTRKRGQRNQAGVQR